jgi:hypothetical protein
MNHNKTESLMDRSTLDNNTGTPGKNSVELNLAADELSLYEYKGE